MGDKQPDNAARIQAEIKMAKRNNHDRRLRELRQAVADAKVEAEQAQFDLREAEEELDVFLSEEPDDDHE
jgi:hypothetical protein